jgi:integrase
MKKTKGSRMFWGIQFYDANKRRRMISLSSAKYNETTARELKNIVETLLYYRNNGITVPDKKVKHWISTASPEILKKLNKVGLIEQTPCQTCKEYWDAFIKTKTGIKTTTLATYDAARARFFLMFDEDEPFADLTNEKIVEWKALLRKSLAEATVAGTIAKVRVLFKWAMDKKWIQKNPMTGVAKGSFVNKANNQNVTREEYLKLLEHCPCQEWRTLLALVRYGGLRCPSEVMKLRWADIDWADNRFLVYSPKTEHHEGKESRFVPLFPEVREELTKLLLRDKDKKNKFVINRFSRKEQTNMGTPLEVIVQRAGLKPIKRPFDNMRTSRSNEVYAKFGSLHESEWIGHSSKVARKHYLEVPEKDFRLASNWSETSSSPETPDGPIFKQPAPPERSTESDDPAEESPGNGIADNEKIG